MNKITKTNIILLLITLVAFIIRIYNNSYPSLLWDEAALGYNAFSILHTLRDEYGQFLPLILKSFGDYKPAIYTYLTIPFVFLFGLNQLSVRLPSIILGSLLPLFTYLLITQINPKAKNIGILAALLIAFNPYNIHFSRGAWETNVLTFQLVLASLFFFKAFSFSKDSHIIRSKYLFLSALVFSISLYTYQAAKMISLFLIITLLILNLQHLITRIKSFVSWFVLPLALMTIPIIIGLVSGSQGNRLKVVSLLSYPRPDFEKQMIISENNDTDYSLFHNQSVFFIRNFTSRYFNHFSPRFLAFEGDWQNPRHSAIYTGVILYPALIFLVIGLFTLFNSRFMLPVSIFFLLWLLTAPIPAALTRDSVQSVRAMSFSIPLMYFTALGLYNSYDFLSRINGLKSKIYSTGFILVSSFFFLVSFIYYTDLYYNHTVIRNPMDYLYGHRQANQYLISQQDKFQNIYMTDFYGQPYIYYLFYSQFDPATYQQSAKLVENAQGDTGKVQQVGKIKFGSIPFDLAKSQPSTLVIYSQDEIWRQGLDKSPDFKDFIPLSPIGQISTFYAYQNP